MLVFQIAKKSLQLITNNFYDVLRICSVLYLLNVIVNMLATYALTGIWTVKNVEFNVEEINSGASVLIIFVMMIFSTVVTLWVAVTWHRYVLLDEAPNGWIPRWNMSANLSYFYQIIKFVLILAVVGMVMAVLIGISAGISGNASISFWAFLAIAWVALAFIILKISLIFPSAAVETNMGVVDSWCETNPYNKTLFALTIAAVSFGFLSDTAINLFDENLFTSMIRFVLNTVSFFWSLSILTTLYGIVVEERDLAD